MALYSRPRFTPRPVARWIPSAVASADRAAVVFAGAVLAIAGENATFGATGIAACQFAAPPSPTHERAASFAVEAVVEYRATANTHARGADFTNLDCFYAGGSLNKFRFILYATDGETPKANWTYAWWAWWPTLASMRTQGPTGQGGPGTTDVNGFFEQPAPVGVTVATEQGFGVISDQDAVADDVEAAYIGTFDAVSG
jgi:hypothetical protein